MMNNSNMKAHYNRPTGHINHDSTVFVGLGYHYHRDTNPTITSSPSSNAPATTSLVDSILQQCLAYHQEQEVIRQQQQQQQQEFSHPTPPEVQFVTATKYDKESIRNEGHETNDHRNRGPIKSDNDSSSDSKYTIEESLQRAQEIINRFHEQQNQLLPPVTIETTNNDTRNHKDDCYNHDVVDPEMYIQQRKIGMEREQKRIRLALLKNLEYIQKKDAEKIQQLQRQVQETSHYEQIAAQQYAIQIQKQKERIVQATTSATPITVAGIGTKERTKIDHKIQKERQQQQQQQTNSTTVAIYISGLPVNENSSDVEDMIQRIFCYYGMIQKIHLYRDKVDKVKLKGDGLIIYKCGQEYTEQLELVQTVCSQMNGIELENGSILNVEPSNSNFQLKINNNSQADPVPSSTVGVSIATNETNRQIPAQSEISESYDRIDSGNHKAQLQNVQQESNHLVANDDVDELDEFFDSL